MKGRENQMRIKMMQISKYSHYGFLLVCVTIFLFVSACCFLKPSLLISSELSSSSSSSSALFVFGSSIFDVGNNNYINTTTSYQANFLPYGITFFKYPTGRFSDGRLIPDFIAEYANLPRALPYLYPASQSFIHGANFASGGAGALAETNKGFVIDLKTQLNYFKDVRETLSERLGDGDAVKLLSKAVYLFNIGTNDYTARFVGNSSEFSSYTREEYVDMVIGNMIDVIKEIHGYGGRKFGILGLGNLGCNPSARKIPETINGSSSDSCREDGSAYARMYNTRLIMDLNKLETQLDGFKYSYTSFYDLIDDMMNHPSKYGFKEGIVACCGSGPFRGQSSCGGKRGRKEYELCENVNEYLFFDYTHLTERAYQYFANQMWSGNTTLTWPYNLKTLFAL